MVYCSKGSTGHQHAIKKRQEKMFNDVELHDDDDDEKRRLKSLNLQILIGDYCKRENERAVAGIFVFSPTRLGWLGA